MIIFLHGKDSFRRQKRLNILKQAFCKKFDTKGFNIETLNGENLTLEIFRKTVLAVGLFVKTRLVIIKDIFSAPIDIQELIAGELGKIGKDNIVIFVAEDFPDDKNNTLLKKLNQADKVEAFPLLKPGQIYLFIQDEIKKRKAIIDKEAVMYLVESVGNDLWHMHNVIEILTSYTKNISLKDAELFVSSPLDSNIFNFMDALSDKNAKLSLKLLHDQLNNGANEFYLLTMLARQIKIILQIKESQGVGLGLHPFVIKKALPASRKFKTNDLKNLFNKIIEIDRQLKNSRGSRELLLDLFVLDMCR